MSGRQPSMQSLLRDLRSAAVPVGDRSGADEQRERVIRSMVAVQAKNAEGRKWGRAVRYWIGIPAAAALLGGVAFAAINIRESRLRDGTAASDVPSLSLLSGHANVQRGTEAHTVSSSEHERLSAGDRVHTDRGSLARITLASGASVDVSALTDVRVVEGNDEHVKMTTGRVDLVVPKLADGHRLVVDTPNAVVAVHGTAFSVRVTELQQGHSATHVAVREGVVSVESGASRVQLHAGETWSSEEEAPKTPLPGAPEAQGTPTSSSEGTAEGAEPSAPLQRGALRNTARRLVRRETRPPEKPATRRDAGSAGFDAKNPDPKSTLGDENALLQRAMEASRQGDPARAVSLLDALLSRYPNSALAQNAKVERFRALGRLGNRQGATRAARRYLAEYPDGMALDEARRFAVEPPDSR